jgi:broad specificity phosphatase PhoE
MIQVRSLALRLATVILTQRGPLYSDVMYAVSVATLYVVRHGRVASSPAGADDPELSAEGQSQALRVAEELRRRLPRPLPILTSPLRRCRQTAAPLSSIWGVQPIVEPRVAEVPGPPASALPREEWLRRSLVAEWPELIEFGESLQDGYASVLTSWRASVLEAVLECSHDVVIFSHFVPVNVLTGHATRSQRVACFLPDHTSVTVFETAGSEIRLIERGREKPAAAHAVPK